MQLVCSSKRKQGGHPTYHKLNRCLVTVLIFDACSHERFCCSQIISDIYERMRVTGIPRVIEFWYQTLYSPWRTSISAHNFPAIPIQSLRVRYHHGDPPHHGLKTSQWNYTGRLIFIQRPNHVPTTYRQEVEVPHPEQYDKCYIRNGRVTCQTKDGGEPNRR